jgi:tetratricopeptide (TPR) repeat protein
LVLAAAADTHAAPVRNFDYYLKEGDRLRERERFEAALAAYGKAVDLRPERPEPVAGRGWTLLDMGKYLQAQASFEQALRLNSRYADAVMGLAETSRGMGRTTDAIANYQRYLDMLPNGPQAPVAKNALERLKE